MKNFLVLYMASGAEFEKGDGGVDEVDECQ
jgi:hypothetical protein